MRIAALFVVFLTGCANLSLDDAYRNPGFSYQSTQVTGVNFDQLNGASVVTIKNPNPYSLPVSALGAELWLKGEPWLALKNDAISGIPASKSINVSFNWTLIFDQLLTRAADVYQDGQADFTLKLAPTLQVPLLGPKTLDWTASFSVPVPKLPKVKLKDWQVSGFSFTKVTLSLDLELDNPNVFSIATQGWNMNVDNNNKSIANFTLKDSILASKGKSIQTVDLSLSMVDVGLAIANSLKSGQWPSSLKLDWRGDWNSPDLGFKLPTLNGQLEL